MLSKKEFVKAIGDIKRNDEFLDKINDLFLEYGSDTAIYSLGLIDTVIDLLETVFKDKVDHWISYWIYECDFGETYKEGDVTEENGTIIHLGNAEELYDFLIKNMEGNV